ncbi:hypothetical protein PPROV_000255900 [Pycnococcus provasolii]|uniref:Anaphase-promoting complex subunit 4 WD40 domain-containing protein n=1 Tax=Pycnococcus provasolii TaxID=41880 RepID=A0A830H9P6_9CHLO|nr:hypothetical protein PPROV_000255900 [Pycnococcus provasolii]
MSDPSGSSSALDVDEDETAPEILAVVDDEFTTQSIQDAGLRVLADLEGQDDDDDEEDDKDGEHDDDVEDVIMDVDDVDGDVDGDGETFTPDRDDATAILGDNAHTASVFAVDVHPVATAQMRVAATGGGDDVAVLWQVPTSRATDGTPARGNPTARLTSHADSISMVRYNTAGTLLATAGLDGKLCVFTVEGEHVATCEGPGGGCEWLTWHPRGDVLLCGCEDFTAWMFNAKDGLCMNVFSGHSNAVGCGKFTRDGKRILTGASDTSVRLWDPRTAACLSTLQGGATSAGAFHEGDVLCCDDALPADVPSDAGVEPTRLCISGGAEGLVYLSDVSRGSSFGAMTGGHENGYSVEVVAFPPTPVGAATAPAPRFAASAGTDGKLVVWDVERTSEWTIKRHPHAITCMQWHPSHEGLVLTAGADAVIRLWDLRAPTEAAALAAAPAAADVPLREYKGHTKAILDLRVSQDGGIFATASDDHTARIYELAL